MRCVEVNGPSGGRVQVPLFASGRVVKEKERILEARETRSEDTDCLIS